MRAGTHFATVISKKIPEESSSFAPTDVANMKAWWDFSDATKLYTDAGSTLVTGDGDKIYQCNDKSGVGNNLIQANADKRPEYKVNIKNGLSVARFDDADDFLRCDWDDLTDPVTFFLVIYPKTGIDNADILAASDGNTYRVDYSDATDVRLYSSTQLISTNNFFTLDNWHLLVANYNGASSVIRGNGSDQKTGATASPLTFAEANIGGRSGIPANCDIGEVLVYNAAITGANLTNIESFLNSKWSIY